MPKKSYESLNKMPNKMCLYIKVIEDKLMDSPHDHFLWRMVFHLSNCRFYKSQFFDISFPYEWIHWIIFSLFLLHSFALSHSIVLRKSIKIVKHKWSYGFIFAVIIFVEQIESQTHLIHLLKTPFVFFLCISNYFPNKSYSF